MKTLNSIKTIKSLLIIACLVFTVNNLSAQNNDIQVHIVTSNNGETTVVDTTFQSTSEINIECIANIDSILNMIDIEAIINLDSLSTISSDSMFVITTSCNIDSILSDLNIDMILGDPNSDELQTIVKTITIDCDDESLNLDSILQTIDIELFEEAGDKKIITKVITMDENGNIIKGDCKNSDVIVITEDLLDSENGTVKTICIKTNVIIEDISEDEEEVLKQSGIENGINDLSIDNLNFYPNPNDGKFNLSFNLAEKGNVQIRIIDMNGKEVYNEKMKKFSGEYNNDIDISNSKKGVYFLQVKQGKKVLNKKIVIQ